VTITLAAAVLTASHYIGGNGVVLTASHYIGDSGLQYDTPAITV